MKHAIIVGLFALTLPFSLFAASEFEEVYVQPYPVGLSDIDSSELWLRWDYAGHISGFCRLELSAHGPLEPILNELDFNGREPYFKDAHNIRFKLHYSTYVDWIQVKVNSGETLKNLLQQLGTSLFARVLPCEPEDHQVKP